MTLQSHISHWEIVANYLNVNHQSLTTARKRYSRGQHFFTTELPNLGKDLEAGLTGLFSLSEKTFFSPKKGSVLPLFLNELFKNIFYDDGYIRENPVGIAELRYLLKMFYKFEAELTPEGIKKATSKFLEVDDSVKEVNYPEGLDQVRKNFASLFPNDPMDIRPHHAAGATSLKYSNLEKRHLRHYIPRLNEVYGVEYFFNSKHHAENWCEVNKTTINFAIPRVTFVPKDSRGPRTISIFHHQDMMIQKGLQVKLYDYTESQLSPAYGYINFSNQEINRNLARIGSIDGSLSTIDLKDASDLVPWNLIRLLCPHEWYSALASTRSEVVKVNGITTKIKKYASMGSALCFPIEAFLFWSIAVTVSPYAYVYGDDIIVPTEHANDVMQALEAYGLKVNIDKSLTTGLFRESCGGDFYAGKEIGYPSCKSYDLDKFIAHCNEVATIINQELAEDLIKWFETINNEPIYRSPLSSKDQPEPYIFYTDRFISSDVFFKSRYNDDLQRYEAFRKHVVSRRENTPMSKKRRAKNKIGKKYLSDDLLFDWFTTAENTVAPIHDAFWTGLDKLCGTFLIEPTTSFTEGHQALRQDSSPVTKYEWGSIIYR